jgi:uncharacterized membrane protein
MKTQKTSKLMTNILGISLAVLLIGQIFKIQHYPHGNLITLIGIGTYLIMSIFEIDRLNKLVAKLCQDDVTVEK